jgi:hypothetical protein
MGPQIPKDDQWLTITQRSANANVMQTESEIILFHFFYFKYTISKIDFFLQFFKTYFLNF